MTSPTAGPEPIDARTAQRLAAYEAWETKLESTLADYVRREGLYRNGFFALTTAGFACFVFGMYPGLWGSVSATFTSVGGYAMYRTRLWELKTEIAEIRHEIRQLRGVA